MATEEKTHKVNELVKRELGKIILKELEFPAGCIATITGCKTNSDLTESKIYISVFPVNRTNDILRILRSQAGFLQRIINRKLRMHFVPKIVFEADVELNAAQKVEQILEKVKMDMGDEE